MKMFDVSVKPLRILRIQNAVNSPHAVVSISLEGAAPSTHHCLQPALEPAADGPHGVPGETGEHSLHHLKSSVLVLQGVWLMSISTATVK